MLFQCGIVYYLSNETREFNQSPPNREIDKLRGSRKPHLGYCIQYLSGLGTCAKHVFSANHENSFSLIEPKQETDRMVDRHTKILFLCGILYCL